MEASVLRFSQRSTGEILATPDSIAEAIWAELSSSLLNHGGYPSPDGVVLTVLQLRLAANELGELLIRHQIKASYDDAVRRLLCSHLQEFQARRDATEHPQTISEVDVKSRVAATGRFDRPLTKSQLRDLGRLLVLMHGANFSVPGAGKTTSLLATYEACKGAGAVDQLLVVAPKNAFLSWEDEVRLCYPSDPPKIARIAGGASQAANAISSDPEIALITYQFLPNVLPLVRDWVARRKTHVVLDESHRIKSGFSGVYAFAALQLTDLAARREILTGTPLPNSPEDLRAQFEFLWPGQQILPDRRLVAEESTQELKQIQDSVVPLYVRTTKRELRLPGLHLNPIAVSLGPLQRELYDLLRSEAKRIAAGLSKSDVRLLRQLGSHVMKLLQGASNPMLLASNEELEIDTEDVSWSRVWELLRAIATNEVPSKIQKTREIVETTLSISQDAKVLIWSSFVQNVHALEKLLLRWQPVIIYGAVATGSDEDADTREGRIRRFHSDPQCRVMIANPAACGEGISLHRACHHAIYVDRTFNAAHYLQSIDRIHRLGLADGITTRIDIIEARDTIDSRVASRLKAKIDAMSVILNDPGLASLAYDPLDVVEEFPAGIQPEDVEQIVDHIIHGDGESA